MGDYVALAMDESHPIGNTQDVFLKRALHVKIGNLSTEAIPVYTTNPPTPPQTEVLDFNQITSVASSATETLYSYTVLPTQTLTVFRILVSGSNIATYDLLIDSVQKARKRTYFGGGLDETFEFTIDPDLGGIIVNPGSTIAINVTNFRPDLGDFEATLIGALSG